MNRNGIFVVFIFSIVLLGGMVVMSESQREPTIILFDFERDFDIDSVITNNAKVALSGNRLRIETGHETQ